MNCGAGNVGVPASNQKVSKHAHYEASGHSSAITASLTGPWEAVYVLRIAAFNPSGFCPDSLDYTSSRGAY